MDFGFHRFLGYAAYEGIKIELELMKAVVPFVSSKNIHVLESPEEFLEPAAPQVITQKPEAEQMMGEPAADQDPQALVCVDARNGFNKFSRKAINSAVKHKWTDGTSWKVSLNPKCKINLNVDPVKCTQKIRAAAHSIRMSSRCASVKK